MIEILNSDLKKIDVLRKYTFVQYVEKFRGVGTFKVNVRLAEENLYLLDASQDFFILFDGTVFGKIENIKKESDSEYERTVELSGRLANYILTKRVVSGTINYKGNTAGLIKGLVESEITSDKESNRYINIAISYNSDELIKNKCSNVDKQITGGYIWDAIEEHMEQDKLGLFLTPVVETEKEVDGIKTNIQKWNLVISTGNDRRRGNAEGNAAVIFSQGLSNIARTDYTLNTKDFCNVAYIAGEGEGTLRKWFVSYQDEGYNKKGWNRNELWIDARDIQSDSDEYETGAEYERLINQRADEKFADSSKKQSYTATLTEANKQYTYGVDYMLGDFITVEDNELDITVDAQITEVTTTIEGVRKIVDVDFTYGSVEKNIVEKIEQNTNIIENNTNNIKYLENKIGKKISAYVTNVGKCQEVEGRFHWKYRMWSNGDFELWRIFAKADSFATNHSSANGWYYSDELVWYPRDLPFKVNYIEQVMVSGDRKGNTGLPFINVVNTEIVDGIPVIKFVVVANGNNTYNLSVEIYMRGTYQQ